MSTEVAHVLPPDGTSPARARGLLRSALREVGLAELADDAVLLATELVTNAVIHAGTALELRVLTDDGGVRVEVHDASPGSTPTVKGSPGEAREGGRGLFLLDAMADEWGTTHRRTGKSVWFRMGARGAAEPPRPVPAAAAVAAEALPSPALGWLLALPDALERRLSSGQLLGELVHRLGDALDVDRIVLAVESEASDHWTGAAWRGEAPDEDELLAVRRAALAATDPVVRDGRRTVLPVRGRGGVFAALVVGGPELDAAATAIARLATQRLAMVLRDERAEVSQQRHRGSLALLAEASDMFAATLDVQLAVALATQLVVPRLAEWAAVFTTSEQGVSLSAVSHADEERTAALRVALSGTAGHGLAERLGRDLAAQKPVLVGRSRLAAAVGDEHASEALAVPLVARHRLLGALVVARPSGAHTAEEVTLLLDLGRRAALAVDNARLYEERTAIAHALQATLLPPELPLPEQAEFGARYLPAGEGNEVGGDFYDVFRLPGGGWGVAIGDVCGKGAEAAAITGLARNVLRLLVREGRSPAEALTRLNDAVLELGDRGRFCTAAVAVVRPAADGSGALEVCLCSAGHPLPVLLQAGSAPSFVGRPGTLLGVVDDVELRNDDLTVAAGDSLVLYTDGVTERRRGERLFGEETLLEVLARAGGRSADGVAGLLEREVRAFAPEVSRDDLAVLVVRATGAPVVEPVTALAVQGI